MNGLHLMHYAWTGWLRDCSNSLPAKPSPALCDQWREDGFDPLSWRMKNGQLQLVVGMREPRTPAFVAQRVKGRWQRALREHPDFPGFKKNFFLRTLGQNKRDDVDTYIRNQALNGDFADPICRRRYHDLRYVRRDQRDPLTDRRVTYDLFHHVVLVTGGRVRMWSEREPSKLSEALPKALEQSGLILYELSLMPDHAHLLVRGTADRDSQQILDTIKEVSGGLLNRTAFWQSGGYIGSVGPYRLQTAMARNEKL